MADRQVTGTGKDSNDTITDVCGSFGTVAKDTAVKHIEDNTHVYYVQDSKGRSNVHVVTQSDGSKYLRTDQNGDCEDNLEDLPDC